MGHRAAQGAAGGATGDGSLPGAGAGAGSDGPKQLRRVRRGAGRGAGGGGAADELQRLRQVQRGAGHAAGGEPEHDRPELPGGGGHVPAHGAVHAPRRADHQHRVGGGVPAHPLHRHLRGQQGLCAELQPGAEPGAEGPGHRRDGGVSLLDEDSVFRPGHPAGRDAHREEVRGHVRPGGHRGAHLAGRQAGQGRVQVRIRGPGTGGADEAAAPQRGHGRVDASAEAALRREEKPSAGAEGFLLSGFQQLEGEGAGVALRAPGGWRKIR